MFLGRLVDNKLAVKAGRDLYCAVPELAPALEVVLPKCDTSPIPSLLKQFDDLNHELRSRWAENRQMRLEVLERDRAYPKGRSWLYMPREVKEAYIRLLRSERQPELTGNALSGHGLDSRSALRDPPGT